MLLSGLDVCGYAGLAYTPPSVDMSQDPPLWLVNLRALVGDARGRKTSVAKRAGMKRQQLANILSGSNDNPEIYTLARIAAACDRSLEDLFARPDGGGRVGRTGESAIGQEEPLAAHLRRAAERIDVEFPAEDSVQGDIYKALAALNRALRRPPTPAEPGPKAGEA